ncbi:restriction endonuclease subunit S [Clostridium perfringens]|uniref:restriction endonuclease subunit S n=1 Tax=Clostridium perfringens TaxID=1502 RepID=UPI0024BD0991|nr:restriction endonuclease subunit S [Clostridium perfringens]
MTYKRYTKYKDSEISWIGKIPNQWECLDFRRLVNLQQGLQIAQEERFYEGGINRFEYITIKYLSSKNKKIDREYIENPNKKVICNHDDVLLARTGATGKVVTGVIGVYHNNFFKINYDRKRVLKGFLVYYLMQENIQEHFKLIAGTTTIPDLNHGEFLSTKIILPNLFEQERIIKFLDKKILEIDSLIEEKEKLIKLLKEKREAIITEAVTKGVDKNVKMKNSGVEWIGDIPIHWEISRLKFTTDKPFMYGANESAELDDKSLPRYIRITDIDEEGCLKKDTFKSMEYEKAKEFLLNDKDILFARSGATVGKTYLYNLKDGSACFAGYLIKYTHNYKVIPEFIYYITKSSWYSCWINQNTIQATIQNVSADKYKNLYIPLPDILEQGRIVDFLSKKCNEIKLVITDIKNQINELRNYKKSLISEVVTGKIDVRDCKG